MAAVATIVAAEFAAPDSDKWTRVAVRATPGKNVAICALDDGEYVTGTLVCHDDCIGL